MANSKLLALPPELRNQIYSHLFTSRHHLDHSVQNPRAPFPTHALSLLLTCRQIHHEAALLAYSTTSFLTVFHRARTLLSRLEAAKLPPAQQNAITSLTIAHHLTPKFADARPLAIFLESMALLTAKLPALQEIVVLFAQQDPRGSFKNLLRSQSSNQCAAYLRHMMPRASFESQGEWIDEPKQPNEEYGRKRGVYHLNWKDEAEQEHLLRFEFVGFWPRHFEARDASKTEVEEALATEGTLPAYELRRRERPFLTAGASNPAERMGRHRRSLGRSSSASGSPESSQWVDWSTWSPPPSRLAWEAGSPRSSFGASSPRSSLGSESPSWGRASLSGRMRAPGEYF